MSLYADAPPAVVAIVENVLLPCPIDLVITYVINA